MESITTTAGLKNAIFLLEIEQAEKGQILKEQFVISWESLKPINLIKGAIHDISASPYLLDNILGTAIGLTTGYLSKKIIVGGSGNMFRKLFGSLLQFGVTNLVAQHPETIKSFSQFIIKTIFRKKEKETE
jgi:hypothetical protein